MRRLPPPFCLSFVGVAPPSRRASIRSTVGFFPCPVAVPTDAAVSRLLWQELVPPCPSTLPLHPAVGTVDLFSRPFLSRAAQVMNTSLSPGVGHFWTLVSPMLLHPVFDHDPSTTPCPPFVLCQPKAPASSPNYSLRNVVVERLLFLLGLTCPTFGPHSGHILPNHKHSD
jgi:hypothetical protein